jgi:hypothetical protein
MTKRIPMEAFVVEVKLELAAKDPIIGITKQKIAAGK